MVLDKVGNLIRLNNGNIITITPLSIILRYKDTTFGTPCQPPLPTVTLFRLTSLNFTCSKAPGFKNYASPPNVSHCVSQIYITVAAMTHYNILPVLTPPFT